MQQKYCLLFKASKQGIERLEIYDNKDDSDTGSCQRIITLENCIKITHSNPNNITIVAKSGTHQFSAATEAESIGWVTALQSVAFGDEESKKTSYNEDNDLYCSSGEEKFRVKLCSSEASTRCGFESIVYNLLITATALELRDVDNNKLYATWPFRYIRRYGYRSGKFTFEAGRKCETGEGVFHLEHSNHHEIFRCLSLKMKSMKKMINGESLHSLDCGDQLQAALSMEARSRSPLPLSAHSEDLNFNSISIKSTSSIHHSTDPHAPLIPPPKPSIKPKPIKPPRNFTLFSLSKDKNDSDFSGNNKIEFGKYTKLDNYEPIANVTQAHSSSTPYDKIEVRNEAWRTLGINEIDHVEFTPKLPNENNCIKLISRSQDNLNSVNSGESSKIIILHSPTQNAEDNNYDRLQYFVSSSKLNRSDGYKSIITRPIDTQPKDNKDSNKERWSDYDEVENLMQPVRLADDSYLGYGMIRKPSIPGPQVPLKTKSMGNVNVEEPSVYSDVDHCAYNGSPYAIVSKPKQV